MSKSNNDIVNKVYCDKPFDHNYIHTNGNYRLCCVTTENIIHNDRKQVYTASKHGVSEYWNSDRMKEIRVKMLKGEKIKDCWRCYKQDEAGEQSLRSTNTLKKYRAVLDQNGVLDLPANTAQLQLGNICNLKCKMCSQMYSHMNGLELKEMGQQDPQWLSWVKEQSGNVNNWIHDLGVKETWYKDKKLKDELFTHISHNVNGLNIIGGEPTLIPEFYEMLERCHSDGTLVNKDITISTNLTNTNDKLIKWLQMCRRWKIWASVDGVGERTEYIRYPSDWNVILRSLDFYKGMMTDNGNLTLSPAVQLLNADQLDDMIKWWLDYTGGLDDNYDFTWLATVSYPLICSPHIAPKAWREKVADKLEKFKWSHNRHGPHYENFIRNLRIDQYTEQQAKHLQQSFIRYNDQQDKFRQVKKTWRQLLPDLEQALTQNLR